MKVSINDEVVEWESSFLNKRNDVHQSKWKKKREDYFCIEEINGVKCFIKRSENGFASKSILEKMIGHTLWSVPEIYAIEESIENNQKVQYLIMQYVEGQIMDAYLNDGNTLDPKSFSSDLIKALSDLFQFKVWHTDVCVDNVLITKSGQAYLIDIDSVTSCDNNPTHLTNTPGALTTSSNELASYALKYYIKYLQKSSYIDFSVLSGSNLNYLQILFLTCQLKHVIDKDSSNSINVWKRASFNGFNAEDSLRSIDSKLMDDFFEKSNKRRLDREEVNSVIRKLLSNGEKIHNHSFGTEESKIEDSVSFIKEVPDQDPGKRYREIINTDPKKNNSTYTLLPVIVAFAFFVAFGLLVFGKYYADTISHNSINGFDGIYANRVNLKQVEISHQKVMRDGLISVQVIIDDRKMEGVISPTDSTLYYISASDTIFYRMDFEKDVPFLIDKHDYSYKKIF